MIWKGGMISAHVFKNIHDRAKANAVAAKAVAAKAGAGWQNTSSKFIQISDDKLVATHNFRGFSVEETPDLYPFVWGELNMKTGKYYWENTITNPRRVMYIGAIKPKLLKQIEDLKSKSHDSLYTYTWFNIHKITSQDIFVIQSNTGGVHGGTEYKSILKNSRRTGKGGKFVGFDNMMSFRTNDIIGCLLDLDNKTLKFYKNGKLINEGFTGVTGPLISVVIFDNSFSGNLYMGRPDPAHEPSIVKIKTLSNMPTAIETFGSPD